MLNSQIAIKTLVHELGSARKCFDRDPQVGVTVAVSAFLEFVGAVVTDERLHEPVVAIVGALIDATEGRLNPLLKPAPNHPSASRTLVADDVDVGRAVAIVTLLKNAGDSLPEALRKVSRALGGALNSKQLKDQRKRITRGNGVRRSNELAVRNYEATIQSAREATDAGMTKVDFVAAALVFLSRTASFASKVERPPS